MANYKTYIEDIKSTYKVVIDYLGGHKILRPCGSEYLITNAELVSYLMYSQEQIMNNMSYTNAIKHINDYLENLIK